MCFSASVSYGAAVVLVPTGLYAAHRARSLRKSYLALASAPFFFGIQQAFEGRIWQLVEADDATGAVPFALAYHFFSHFFWLWWIPLSSYLVEESVRRRRAFFGIGVFGFLVGGTVYSALLLNPSWMSVKVKGHAIKYHVASTFEAPTDLSVPITPSALYALVILLPLLFSSHRHVRVFGVLVALSVALAATAYDYAFVSVWCFFAAVISLYLVLMIRRLPGLRVRRD